MIYLPRGFLDHQGKSHAVARGRGGAEKRVPMAEEEAEEEAEEKEGEKVAEESEG